MKKIGFLILLLSPAAAFANFDMAQAGGRQRVDFINVGPSGQEICILPKHFVGASYENVFGDDGSNQELDLKAEIKLCSIDLHNTNESTFAGMTLEPAAVCPKLTSTNPGLDIYGLANTFSKDQTEATLCKVPDLNKIAKFKFSTSCSYTPSIIGYYHLSRMLGGVLHVPVAVVRTVDQSYHLAMAQKGLRNTKPTDIIHQTFQALVTGLGGHGNSSFNDKVLTTQKQSYGALIDSKKDHEFYKEFFNQGSDRALAFKTRNPYYKMISTEKPLKNIIGQELNQKTLQTFVALKDLSEMLIMDYLMNQKDRFGNIDSLNFLYFKDAAGDLKRMPLAKAPQGFAGKPGVFNIKEMTLKDNDCGGSDRSNVMKIAGLTDGIKHISPGTYKRLLWLNANADSAVSKEFLAREMLFTPQDQSVFRSNLQELATKLKSFCQQGKLHLDLDHKQYFQGIVNPDSKSCDL